MKKLFLTIFLALIASLASAEDKRVPYIEGSIGYFNAENNHPGNFHYGPDGNPVVSVSLTNTYNSAANYNFEVGVKNIFKNFRIGLSETFMRTKATTSGVIVTTVNTLPEVQDKGHSNTNFVMLNTYYDLPVNFDLKPYLGFGLGVSKNNKTSAEFAYSFLAGANYPFNENVYVGGKATYYQLNQSTVEDGSNNTISRSGAYALNALIGYQF